jgi:hypothetical protein
MNGNEINRKDVWLPVLATVILFRIALFASDMLLSVIGILLARIPFHPVHYLIGPIPVMTLVIAVATAARVTRFFEPRLVSIGGKKKTFLFVLLLIAALFPWQLIIRATSRPANWDELPLSIKKEMRIHSPSENQKPLLLQRAE